MSRFLLCSAFLLSLAWTPYSTIGSQPKEIVGTEVAYLAADEESALPLRLDVEMPSKKLGPGDDLVVEVKVTNTSGADLAYYPTDQPRVQFQEKESKQVWVTQASLFPPPPGAPPSLVTWKKGEEKKSTVRLGPQTKYAHAGSRPETARVGLPLGKYLLHVKVTYFDHYPELKRNALAGTLNSKPIEFEVVGK